MCPEPHRVMPVAHDNSFSQNRFVRLVNATSLPARQSSEYSLSLRKLHAAILGICAIVDSFPYTVERWMPALLTDVLAEHTYDPVSLLLLKAGSVTNYHVNRARFPFPRPSVSARVILRKRIRTPGMKIRRGSVTINFLHFQHS